MFLSTGTSAGCGATENWLCIGAFEGVSCASPLDVDGCLPLTGFLVYQHISRKFLEDTRKTNLLVANGIKVLGDVGAQVTEKILPVVFVWQSPQCLFVIDVSKQNITT